MLKLVDHGCNIHHQRQLTFKGIEAEVMTDILLYFLTSPQDGDFRTFVCEHGHSHRISFHILMEDWYHIAAKFPLEEMKMNRA